MLGVAGKAARGKARARAGVLAAALIVASLSAAPAARAGAWTEEAGHGQVIAQTTLATADREFGPDYRLYDSRPYDKVEVTLAFEYGATDWLTLIAAPQFLNVDLGDPDPATYTGLGYTDLGARARLVRGDGYVISAQVVGRIPGTGNSPSAAAVGYEDAELDLRLLAGVTFTLWGRDGFLDLEAAQRLRFGDPPDEFRLDATVGLRVMPRWQLLLQSFNVISEGAGEGPYFSAAYEYYKVGFGAGYEWSEALTLQMGLVATYFARNAPQETALVLTALYRF